MELINEKTGVVLTIIGITLLIASVIIFPYKHIVFDFTETINSEKFGHFGDFVGGLIGSIFSLVGVILFYVALKHQREELSANREILQLEHETLKLQLEEFKNQREELEETRKVFQDQLKNQNIQRFENTFFQLSLKTDSLLVKEEPNLMETSCNELILEIKKQTWEFRFYSHHGSFKKDIVFEEEKKYDTNYLFINDTLLGCGIFFNTKLWKGVSTYFNSRIHIINYVKESKLIDEREKGFYYLTILNSIDSERKLILLYYLIFLKKDLKVFIECIDLEEFETINTYKDIYNKQKVNFLNI